MGSVLDQDVSVHSDNDDEEDGTPASNTSKDVATDYGPSTVDTNDLTQSHPPIDPLP